MARPKQIDYAGAAGPIKLDQVRRLDRRAYVLQEKVDGCYARITCDGTGRVSSIISRSGKPFRTSEVGDLIGIPLAYPGTVLVGEFEARTEAGNRAAETRGYRNVHLFDAIKLGGNYVARAPYRRRRHLLHRMIVAVEMAIDGKPWYLDEYGRPHHVETGKFCSNVPRTWKRFPLVEQHPVTAADELYERARYGESEGVVVVAQGAKLGERGSKRKLKPTRTLDLVVEGVSEKRVLTRWVATGDSVVVGRNRKIEQAQPGDVVEVACDGFYEKTGTPRFVRGLRVRTDLRRWAV